MDLVLTGRPVDAAEAHAIGLADRVVPAGDALAAAQELAAQIAAFPQTCLRHDRMSLLEQEGLDEPAALAGEWARGRCRRPAKPWPAPPGSRPGGRHGSVPRGLNGAAGGSAQAAGPEQRLEVAHQRARVGDLDPVVEARHVARAVRRRRRQVDLARARVGDEDLLEAADPLRGAPRALDLDADRRRGPRPGREVGDGEVLDEEAPR